MVNACALLGVIIERVPRSGVSSNVSQSRQCQAAPIIFRVRLDRTFTGVARKLEKEGLLGTIFESDGVRAHLALETMIRRNDLMLVDDRIPNKSIYGTGHKLQ
jgi:hypothetical protein